MSENQKKYNNNNNNYTNNNKNNNTSNKNNNNNYNNNNVSENKNKNNELNEYIKKTANQIREGKKIYDSGLNMVRNTPLIIKIMNIVVPGILTLIYTSYRFNLGLSIFFAILTFIAIYILGGYYAIVFMILYIIYVVKEKNKKDSYLGYIIPETDIFKNGSPFDCSKDNGGLIVNYNNYKNGLDTSYFSYSFWLYVNNNNSLYKNNWSNYRYSEWKSIFYAGNRGIEGEDVSGLRQFPGFWFSPKLNNIVLLFQTESNLVERMEIMDVPMNQWFNLVLVVENRSASVYINCKMENNFSLVNSSPNISEYNLYIAKDEKTNYEKKNGFPGFIANLSYYSYSLNQSQINQICNEYGSKFRSYQMKENSKVDYKTSCLITDSDRNNI